MSPDTRNIILQVANRLFVKQGYTATSIRQIAAEANIGKATIYHHFMDKQAIVMALLEQVIAQQQESLVRVKAENDPRHRIETATRVSLSFFLESANLIQVVRQEVPDGREYLQLEYATFWREYTALLTESLRQGREQGLFRPVDPAEGAKVLMAMIQGAFASTYMSNEQVGSPDKFATSLLDIYFRGIEK